MPSAVFVAVAPFLVFLIEFFLVASLFLVLPSAVFVVVAPFLVFLIEFFLVASLFPVLPMGVFLIAAFNLAVFPIAALFMVLLTAVGKARKVSHTMKIAVIRKVL